MELQLDGAKGQEKPDITFSCVKQFGDFFGAGKLVVGDLKNYNEAYVAFGAKNSTGDFYLRADCLKRFLGLGCSVSPNDKFNHSFELQYDAGAKPAAGIYGMPLFFRFGGLYHLNKKIKLTAQLNAGKGLIMTNKFEVPVGKKIKATLTDQVDLASAYTDPKSLKHTFGIALELK